MLLARAMDFVEGSRAQGDRAREGIEREGVRVRAAREAFETIKTCGCGRAYTRATWARLPRVGEFDVEGEEFELRQCECFSTIAVLL